GGAGAARARVGAQIRQLSDAGERRGGQILRRILTIENPDRLKKEAAERDERHAAFFLFLGERFAGAATNESEIDLLLGIAKEMPVDRRALGRPQHDLDLVPLQRFLVALAEFGVVAVVGPGGE